MIHRIHQALEEKEEGFTLIELLVVVIIIGILAAIAIPVFLNQREKAWDSAAKSDVRNMTTAQETYLTEHDEYSTTVGGLEDNGFSKSDSVQHATCGDSTGYVAMAKHENSDNYFYFDSDTGQTSDDTTNPGTSAGHCDPGSLS